MKDIVTFSWVRLGFAKRGGDLFGYDFPTLTPPPLDKDNHAYCDDSHK